MKNPIRTLIISITIITIIVAGCFVYKFYFLDKDSELKQTKILETISDYNYNLEDRDTAYYKDIFGKLKLLLDSEHEDGEYAKYVSILFVTDLYTLSNKVSKYDVGGVEFVYSASQEDFKSSVKTSLYRYLEDDSHDDRNQDLPIVKNVETECNEDEFEIDGKKQKSYVCNNVITYEEDLGYDTEVKVILVKENKKLSVVESNY